MRKSSAGADGGRGGLSSAPISDAVGITPRAGGRDVLVEAREVGRTYRCGETRIAALSSATCAVTPGDRIALVGASGSGKSTLLHLLGGLDTPTSGELRWPALGERSGLHPAKVAFVFQMPSLLPALSVLENVELPLLLGHVSASNARLSAQEALDRLALGGIAGKLPEDLSGGQAQRVAMARALAYQPALILADEPTGQLDHRTAMHVFDVVLAAIQGTPTALVVATHDRAVAERLDAVWRMRHGVLEVTSAC